jgi:predicted pyridoxine 5'-phosphate oxidase superfamily flavin-nucleotide-binding protein
MNDHGPFHEGELEAQRRAGESLTAAANSPMIGNRIMSGAVQFLREQPMAVIGSRDANGRLWSSILFGRPGFLEPSPNRQSMQIHIDAQLQDPHDPLWKNISGDRQVGILVIEPATRRRLRINGRLTSATDSLLTVQVEESFGNCPKYIQRRTVRFASAQTQDPPAGGEQTSDRLQSHQRELVEHADTLFVTSAHPTRGLDTSHRGGNPGFIKVLDEKTLRIPDYPGNSMFNTIGNLLVDPRAGLLIPDFEGHSILQATGTVEVVWAKPSERDGDTGRSWIFHIDEIKQAPMQAALQTHFIDYSPFNPATSPNPDYCPL